MSTKFQVTNARGDLLGIFPKGEMPALKAFVAANAGAKVKPLVTVDNPCAQHVAYAADNCPLCGTSIQI